jgi:hypothetical protein
MASERTRVEFIGGDHVDIAAPPDVVRDNLLDARANNTYCTLITDIGNAEILVNPDAVRLLRPEPPTV